MSFTLAFSGYPSEDGPLLLGQVPWDSELFGFPCWEVRWNNASPLDAESQLAVWLNGLAGDRSCLVCSKVPSNNVLLTRALTRNGFYLVETLLEIYAPMARVVSMEQRQPKRMVLRLASEVSLPRVVEIAGAAFSADRFHLDPNLDPEKADLRYARWVEQGFRGGDTVYVYEDLHTGRVIGFFQIRETGPGTVDLSLAAVDVPYQRSGIGALMYQAALDRCRESGYQSAVTRVSINNLDVVNLFMRLGFTVRTAMSTLHWYRAAP